MAVGRIHLPQLRIRAKGQGSQLRLPVLRQGTAAVHVVAGGKPVSGGEHIPGDALQHPHGPCGRLLPLLFQAERQLKAVAAVVRIPALLSVQF